MKTHQRHNQRILKASLTYSWRSEVKSGQIMEMVESEQFENESEKSSADSSSESEGEKEGKPESEEYQKLNESSSSADLLEDAP